MAKLKGIYSEDSAHPATEPEHIEVWGTSAEHEQIGLLPSPWGGWSGPVYRARKEGDVWVNVSDAIVSREIPPDKAVVRDIARKVEVQCDDARLIDWMKQP